MTHIHRDMTDAAVSFCLVAVIGYISTGAIANKRRTEKAKYVVQEKQANTNLDRVPLIYTTFLKKDRVLSVVMWCSCFCCCHLLAIATQYLNVTNDSHGISIYSITRES